MTSYKGKIDLDQVREDILRRWKHGDPAVSSYVDEIRSVCAYRFASAKETREAVDRAMGDRSLSEMVLEMREEGY